jgi:hypothetical protein
MTTWDKSPQAHEHADLWLTPAQLTSWMPVGGEHGVQHETDQGDDQGDEVEHGWVSRYSAAVCGLGGLGIGTLESLRSAQMVAAIKTA